MLQERRHVVFRDLEYVFYMINKGQVHTGIIFKETRILFGAMD